MKIKFGLSNVRYAVLTNEEKWTYGEVKEIPGGVKLSLSAEGESSPFYADDINYFETQANNGFSGDLEIALIPDEFKKEVLGYEEDETTGMLLEVSSAIPKIIALMYQFKTDEKARKVCLYKVSVGRPSMEHATKGENIEPQTDTIPIKVLPMLKGNKEFVKGISSSDSKNYATFYDSVPVPGGLSV